MQTVLVTGGSGFIGSALVRQLMEREYVRVVNLDKLTYAATCDSLASVVSNPRYIFVRGDIGDRTIIDRVLHDYRPEAIVNLAAESHVDRSIDDPETFIHTNVVGTFRLLEATRQYSRSLPANLQSGFRFLQISTDEVYGTLGATGTFDESMPYRPNSPYAASKAAADHFARAYANTYGLPVLVTHCSNNYGPYQFPEKLIPMVILNAVEGKPLPIYGDGQQVRDWLFVEDHCRALRMVLQRGRPGEVYNIGGNCERSNLQVVGAICAAVDRLRPGLPHAPCARLITHVPDRPGHDRRYAIDAAKIRRQLGWRPHYDFESGVALTVEWYLANAAWVKRAHTVYGRERLGLERERRAA